MNKSINYWIKENYIGLAIYNIFLMSLIMLRSAGYFGPYFLISINFIVVASLIAFIVLFRINSRAMYIISLLFWLFAGTIKILRVDIWAERTAIYSYQAFVVASVLLLLEQLNIYKSK